ncbi:MAG: SDR family NAD(P)-dependent oxidoreductase [Planctomycetota bacterium]|nr:SDR family NAD(P)-dependent oxidoreductase [Planctomycetota bacterium]MDP7131684.1 SDR family NAD(P)-dependent oxidoreductase [Planctomycetota bacterium]
MSNHVAESKELQGQVAVVTGGAQGLGLGIAKELALRGAAVTIVDLQEEKAQRVAEDLRSQGLVIEASALDVTDSPAVTRCFDTIAESQGRLDILVNCAGIGQKVSPVVELDDAEWQKVIDITLTGTFYTCRAAARHMEKRGTGSIVNLASINGQNPAALVAAYNVAKAGVIMFTRSLALELAAYGVRVNAVSPGPVYTDFNKTVMAQRCETLGLTEEQMIEKIRGAIPLGRWGEPEDIANAVAFLCSPNTSWMTGEVLRVSGGLEGVAAAPPKR